MNTNTFKSIGAVLAGMITGAALSIGTDTILETTGVFPNFEEVSKYGFNTPWMLTLALFYRSIYTVAGGYITAILAPNRPIRHAVILGIIGVVVSTLGAFVAWELSPAWYPIALILIALPCVWLGAKLYELRISAKNSQKGLAAKN